MAGWQNLPPELIIAVLQLVSQRDRSRLSRVSHRLHAIAEPILYKDLEVVHSLARPERLRNFVRTFVLRPELGPLVKKLDLELGYTEHEGCYHDLSAEECEAKLALFENCGIQDLRLFLEAAATHGMSNGLILHHRYMFLGGILLLLHYLPNLKDLRILSEHYVPGILLSSFMPMNIKGVPAALQKLQNLEYDYRQAVGVTPVYDRGIHARILIPFLASPALSGLKIHNLLPDSRGLGIAEQAPGPGDRDLFAGCSIITKLSLLHSSADIGVVCDYIRLPQRLEAFEYSVGVLWTGDVVLLFKEITTGLLPHAHCLKKLILADTKGVRGGSFKSTKTNLNVLAELSTLEYLRLPVTALLGLPPAKLVDTSVGQKPLHTLPLPASLVHLQLAFHGMTPKSKHWTLSMFLSVTGIPQSMNRSKAKFPELRRLDICPRREAIESEQQYLSESALKEGGAFAGVEIQVIFNRPIQAGAVEHEHESFLELS